MKSCTCGSMAINPHCHGREPGVDLDLCDVCYWRSRCGELKEDAEKWRALMESFSRPDKMRSDVAPVWDSRNVGQ
jgi:hypothetical protein